MSGRILRAYSEHLTLFSDLETKRGYIGCLSLQRKVVIFGITTKTTRVGGSLWDAENQGWWKLKNKTYEYALGRGFSHKNIWQNQKWRKQIPQAFLFLLAVGRHLSTDATFFFMLCKQSHWLPLHQTIFSRILIWWTVLRNKCNVYLRVKGSSAYHHYKRFRFSKCRISLCNATHSVHV